ncbi:MAG: ECF transporter S component [Eubacterium sp.]|nr:ECF transporter S component [Eubacterium sp.]MBR7060729.1 ECF transporter S component [Eubacterium sp.]
MKTNTRKIVGIGLMAAIVVVLQLLASTIKLGMFSITLTLVPIIVGAALYGIGAGALLGLAFGITVLASGDAGAFLAISVPGTIVTVLAKGVLAGLAAGAVYKAIEKKNKLAAAITAGVVAPVVNTGVFAIGCWLFFMPFIKQLAQGAGAENAALFVLTGVIGANFFVELAINLVLATVIVRIVNIARKEK